MQAYRGQDEIVVKGIKKSERVRVWSSVWLEENIRSLEDYLHDI
jgi:hypothetical protein